MATGVGHIRAATANGIPNPFPFFFCAFTRARRASQLSKSSPSFATIASGVGHIRASTRVANELFSPLRAASFNAAPIVMRATLPLLTGVGHDPYSVAAVRGTNGGSRYAMPFRIKPERGQVSENSSKSPPKQSCDVLHDDVAWS